MKDASLSTREKYEKMQTMAEKIENNALKKEKRMRLHSAS